MSLDQIKGAKEKLGAAAAKMREITDLCFREKRGYTTEETAAFDAANEDANQAELFLAGVEKTMARERATEDLAERNLRAYHDPKPKTSGKSDRQQAIRGAWGAFLKGPKHATSEEIEAARACGLNPYSDTMRIRMTPNPPTNSRIAHEMYGQYLTRGTSDPQHSTATTLGPEVVGQDQSMLGQVEVALCAFGGLRNVARVLRTETGGDMPLPSYSDFANKATIISQNSANNVVNLQFKTQTLRAYRYDSGAVLVPIEWLQDAAINVPTEVGRALGERIARGTHEHFTTGSGSGQPNGVATMAIAITSPSTATLMLGTTASHEQDLNFVLNLYHDLDPAYRDNATWMFHDSVLKMFRKVRTEDGDPIWQNGLATNQPPTILGRPYVINQDMATNVTKGTTVGTTKLVLFGDFNKHIVRDVMDVELVRADELYQRNAQIGFWARSRHDSITVQASTVKPPIVFGGPSSDSS